MRTASLHTSSCDQVERLEAMSEAILEAVGPEDERLEAINGRLDELDPTGAEPRARKILSGLGFADHLVPMDRAVEQLPEVRLPGIAADSVKHGQSVLVRHLPAEGLVRLYEEEQFIGIGVIDDDGKVAPRRLVTAR